jgi:eukaryotic-like serine/threonine-protein kinase
MEAGQVVGSLVLRDRVAEGGMGTVWAAEHIGLGRIVAVKFLAAHVVDQPMAISRFTHEARLLARIKSPHTPQVFDHGISSEGTPYIAMELIEGTELRDWVEKHGTMSVLQVSRLVAQVSEALTAAHDLGIIHRDIKPENILISGGPEDFHVTLIDFGIAKSLVSTGAAISHFGVALGTPSYMSPEQVMGVTEIDERTDFWSLGVVAYWCLTQKLPFVGDLAEALYIAIHLGVFRPVTALRPELPPELDAWFARALAQTPMNRFESAHAMSQSFLESAYARGPEEPIPLVIRVSASPRSSRRIVQLMCATMFGVLAATGTRGIYELAPTTHFPGTLAHVGGALSRFASVPAVFSGLLPSVDRSSRGRGAVSHAREAHPADSRSASAN